MYTEKNHRVKDCPFLIPDVNMKMFTELQKETKKDPYNGQLFGNSFKHKD